MNKKGMTGLAAIIFTIAFCGAFSIYHLQGSANDSPISEIADVNNTTNVSKDLNATNNTTNQTAFMVSLEKPPFID
jgi:hypothetical protein